MGIGIKRLSRDNSPELNCPALYCDICNQEIIDLGMAMVAWHNLDGSDAKVVHKGQCLDSIDYGLLLTEELNSWLKWLVFNNKWFDTKRVSGDEIIASFKVPPSLDG